MTARRLKSKVLYYYQAGGKKIALGSNLVAAREEWARLEAGGTAAAMFPKVTALYRSQYVQTLALSSRSHYRIALDNLDLAFKAFTLEQIEPKHVKAYMRRRTRKGAAIFEKRVGATFFEWARDEGHTKAPNPFRGVKFSRAESRSFSVGKKRPYMPDSVFDEIYARADEILKDAMDLALLTGQRPSDILKARRQDIVDWVLWFEQEKTGAKVGIKVEGPLAIVLERILTRERPVPSMYLICDRRGQRVLYNALAVRFAKARTSSRWQFRDIRGKSGADSSTLKEAQERLGHADEATTARHYRGSKGNVVSPLDRKI